MNFPDREPEVEDFRRMVAPENFRPRRPPSGVSSSAPLSPLSPGPPGVDFGVSPALGPKPPALFFRSRRPEPSAGLAAAPVVSGIAAGSVWNAAGSVAAFFARRRTSSGLRGARRRVRRLERPRGGGDEVHGA